MSTKDTIIRNTSQRIDFQIPGYRLEKTLGEGGMGAVYLGWDTQLDRKVAIKTILGSFSEDPDFKRRFKAEGKKHASLKHENILRIYAAGSTEEGLYFIMDYAAGGTLAEKLKDGPLEPAEAANNALSIASGLSYAHSRRPPVIHLDIKPDNLLIDDGRIVISDFGIARNLEQTVQPGSVVAGDPRYWAPEQQENKPVARTDIYSFGLVFFEMLAGRRPSAKIINTSKDADSLVKELPAKARSMGPLIAKCLANNPENRPTAAELVAELKKIVRPPISIWRKILVVTLIAVTATFLATDNRAVRYYESANRYLFPPAQVEVGVEANPPVATVVADGTAQPFHLFELDEGSHTIAVVADGYVGQLIELELDADAGPQELSLNLEQRPAITDAEYRNFAVEFDADVDVEAMKQKEWTDPTLINLVALEDMTRRDSPEKPLLVQRLETLAAAGDEVAQTTLYYATLEGLITAQPVGNRLPALESASRKGYALASVLQALHILNELNTSNATLGENQATVLKLQQLAKQVGTQGMPGTARIIEAQVQRHLSSD